MIIEICSYERAAEAAFAHPADTAFISITSKDQKDAAFVHELPEGTVLSMHFNDLYEEYDEDGIPYGRPLPKQDDFKGLKEFIDSLQCAKLIIHCNEGISRSAAVSAAVYEYRGCRDTLLTHQRFAPNRLVYALACGELGMQRKDLRYEETISGGYRILKKER